MLRFFFNPARSFLPLQLLLHRYLCLLCRVSLPHPYHCTLGILILSSFPFRCQSDHRVVIANRCPYTIPTHDLDISSVVIVSANDFLKSPYCEISLRLFHFWWISFPWGAPSDRGTFSTKTAHVSGQHHAFCGFGADCTLKSFSVVPLGLLGAVPERLGMSMAKCSLCPESQANQAIEFGAFPMWNP